MIQKLKKLRERDELEFKYQLRSLLKKSQLEGLDAFLELVENFKREIVFDSFFFIDIINESVYLFYLESDENFEKIVSLISILAPVGDRTTLDILYKVVKKLPRHNPHYPTLVNYYGEIEHKVSFLEQKIKNLKLSPMKSMIVKWYE